MHCFEYQCREWMISSVLHCFLYAFQSTEPLVRTWSNANLERGSHRSIPCSYGWPVDSVTWSKGDAHSNIVDLVSLSLTNGNMARSGWGYDGDRFNISDDYSLVLKDVMIWDGGRYFCTVFDPALRISPYSHTNVMVFGWYPIILLFVYIPNDNLDGFIVSHNQISDNESHMWDSCWFWISVHVQIEQDITIYLGTPTF